MIVILLAVALASSFSQPVTGNEEMVAATVAPRTMEEYVKLYFADMPVMAEIARCESQYRHLGKNGTVIKGLVDPADVGIMQINKRYHGKTAQELGLNLNDMGDNVAYARYLYEKYGTEPWNASKKCWDKDSTIARN